MKQEPKKIYITVGNRFDSKPIKDKISFDIYPNDSITEIQLAKKFRKLYCGSKPSELYWAIFDNPNDEKPRICSKNYIQGNLVSVHTFMMIGV